MKNIDNEKCKIVNTICLVTILANVILSIIKFIAGGVGHSTAMISDSIHSISDVITTVIALIGIKMSSHEKDREHPYGHERFECVASMILSFTLFITGLLLVDTSLSSRDTLYKLKPSMIALVVAIISIVVKEVMYRYTMYYAKKINSIALKADAHHHRSDALSSLGALVGIALSMIGFKYGDMLASLCIAVIICYEAFKIFSESVDKIVDKACDISTVKDIEKVIKSVNGVMRIDELRTRQFGDKMYVDADIAVDGEITLAKAHEIAEEVHDTIETKFNDCKHIMVHVNPY